MTMKRFFSSILLLAATLLASLPLCAQQTTPETFVDTVDVRVVNLEAVVVDRRGERVSGLGPEDFRLRVDGQEVPIGFFNEIAEGRAVAKSADSGEDVPGLEEGRPVGTSYLVFIDDYFTKARDRNLVLDALRDHLAQLGPEDRMAIVAYDGNRVSMLSNWSGDLGELQTVFDRARRRPALGLQTLAQVRLLDPRPRVGSGFTRFERNIVTQDLETRLSRLTQAVTASLRGFGQPPGRKVMLLVAGEWPYSPHRYLQGGVDPPDLLNEDLRGRRLLQPIYETANLLGYTLYPIDAPGAPGPPVNAAEGGFPNAQVIFRDYELDSTFLVLARETGGRAMTAGLRLSALEHVVDDTRSYYWLGFTPSWQGDNRSHKVELEVVRPGLEVRTRRGFRDLSRSLEVSFMVESALLFGELPGAAGLEIGFGRSSSRGLGKLEVPVEVKIPMDAVTTLPAGDGYRTALEMRIAVVDEHGRQSPISVIPLQLEKPRAPQPGETAIYETALVLRKRPHDVVVALHDPVSGAILSGSKRFVP